MTHKNEGEVDVAKTIIHVNGHIIKHNVRNGDTRPPITVKTSKTNQYTQRVEILDKDGNVVAQVIHGPACGKAAKGCGATVWVETVGDGTVNVIDPQEAP